MQKRDTVTESETMGLSSKLAASKDKTGSPNRRLFAGVLVMIFYLINCVVQNEVYSKILKGSDSSTNCSAANATNVDMWESTADYDEQWEWEESFTEGNATNTTSSPIENVTTSVSPEFHNDCNKSTKFDKPYFITWWNHCFLMIVLPPVLIYLAIAGDVPGSVSDSRDRVPLLNNQENYELLQPRPPPGLKRITWYLECHGLTWRKLFWISSWAGFLFMELNYLWYVGLASKGMIASEASAAANSSFAWVYVMSICILKEKVDWVKILAVLGCLGGVAMMAIDEIGSDDKKNHKKFELSAGILVEFGCAVSQAFYFVAFRRWALQEGRYPWLISALIAGFEGVFHLLVLWIGMVILNYTGVEIFEIPSHHEFEMISIGASITSTGCIALMVGLALLPSPLIVSIATLATTPCQFAADLLFDKKQAEDIGTLEAIGGGLVLITFGLVIARDAVLSSRNAKLITADDTTFLVQ